MKFHIFILICLSFGISCYAKIYQLDTSNNSNWSDFTCSYDDKTRAVTCSYHGNNPNIPENVIINKTMILNPNQEEAIGSYKKKNSTTQQEESIYIWLGKESRASIPVTK